jgi:predicted TIM-barrel fold metal-dependent hydrolase
MDAHGIAKAVVLPLVSPESFWYPVSTEFVLRETRPHRDRLIPFCAIDPRTLITHLPTKREVVDILTRYRDDGARGFGEHKPMLSIDDPLCMRLYEACSEVKLPLLFHLDNFANMDAPGLPGLAKALAAYPELIFIGHGKGWWSSIAGGITQADLQVGYPRGPVAPGGAIDRLMSAHQNLYGDLSSSGAHAVLRDPKFGREFLLRRADRLLFGTDYYDPATQKDFAQFNLIEEFDLPAEAINAISHGNAERLLQLAEKR